MKYLLKFTAILFLVFTSKISCAQDDPYNQRFLGRLDVRSIQSNPEFYWFAKNYDAYTPQASAIKAMELNLNGLNFIVFGNLREINSQSTIPEFYKIIDLLKINRNRVLLYCLDRDKKSPQGFENKYYINELPTIIILKNGIEMGRVEGTYNDSLEGELADTIINNLK